MTQISRTEAKDAGLKQYFTGRPCSRGHVEPRLVSNCVCLACAREKMNARWAKNPEASREMERAKYAANKERCLAAAKGWRERNPEVVPTWRKENAAKLSAQRATWRSQNRGKGCADYAQRDAIRRKTTLKASPESIAAIYARARHLTQLTGVQHHVDHIVPMRGKTVCGLHVPWNLQCLPKLDNRSKGNRL